MAENITIANVEDSRIDSPNKIYTGNSLQVDEYLSPRQTFGATLVVGPGSDVDFSGVEEITPQSLLDQRDNQFRQKQIVLEELGLVDMNTRDSLDPSTGKTIQQVPRTSQDKEYIPMFLDMIDRNFDRKDIYLGNEVLVSTLKMNPNPETISINTAKKINRYMTMTRFVEDHWGDEIDSVSLTGSTFSFFGNFGLTSTNRGTTQAYLWLKELVKFYQVNGCVYQGSEEYDTGSEDSFGFVTDFLSKNPQFKNNHPRKGMIKERLYLRLTYDYLTLIGRFESFDLVEDQSMPYRMQYNAIFKAEKTVFNLDSPPGAQGVIPLNGSSQDSDRDSNNVEFTGYSVNTNGIDTTNGMS